MRVAYVHQYFADPTSDSGGSRSYDVASALADEGVEVRVLTSAVNTQPGTRSVQSFRVSAARIGYRPGGSSVIGRILPFLWFAIWTTVRLLLMRPRPDLVLATSTPLTVAVPALIAKRVRGIPFIFEVRDLWPALPIAMGELRHPWLRRRAISLEAAAYAQAEHVIALSEGMAAGVRGVNPEVRISVVPNWAGDAPLPEVTRGPEYRGKVMVGYCGSIGPVNDLEGWLSPLAALAERVPLTLHLVGSGPSLERVLQSAARYGPDLNLVYHGVMPKRQALTHVATWDVALGSFVPLPEMEMNSSNKFFDALSVGTPIAINYGGWQAELLAEARAGVSVKGMDTEQAAREVWGLIARLPDAENAARRVAEEYSRPRLVDKVVKTILETGLRGRHAE